MPKVTREDENGVVIVEQFDETKPGSPDRVPEEPAMGNEGVYDAPVVKEHDVLGTTDGDEPRVVADDLLKEIQRPIKPSALPESHEDAVVGSEDEDVEEDHDSRIVVQDPRRSDLPEVEGVKVVQVDEEPVDANATHVAGQSNEEKEAARAIAQPRN